MLSEVSAGFRAANSSAKCLQGKADFSFYLSLITAVSWHKDGWKSARCKSPGAPKKASQARGFAGRAFPSPQIPVCILKVPFGLQGSASPWGQWSLRALSGGNLPALGEIEKGACGMI